MYLCHRCICTAVHWSDSWSEAIPDHCQVFRTEAAKSTHARPPCLVWANGNAELRGPQNSHQPSHVLKKQCNIIKNMHGNKLNNRKPGSDIMYFGRQTRTLNSYIVYVKTDELRSGKGIMQRSCSLIKILLTSLHDTYWMCCEEKISLQESPRRRENWSLNTHSAFTLSIADVRRWWR